MQSMPRVESKRAMLASIWEYWSGSCPGRRAGAGRALGPNSAIQVASSGRNGHVAKASKWLDRVLTAFDRVSPRLQWADRGDRVTAAENEGERYEWP